MYAPGNIIWASLHLEEISDNWEKLSALSFAGSDVQSVQFGILSGAVLRSSAPVVYLICYTYPVHLVFEDYIARDLFFVVAEKGGRTRKSCYAVNLPVLQSLINRWSLFG